jgi:hypothetical protein
MDDVAAVRSLRRPRKDYHDDELTEAERRFRIRRYRASLRDWFRSMDCKRHRDGPRSTRETRFCAAFAFGVRALMAIGKKSTKKELIALGVDALDDAGYCRPSESKSAELLDLPRVQAGVALALAAQGVTIDKCGEVLARILDDTANNALALSATELYFRVTTGFAVTKQATLVKHERADKFFDEKKFANPGKPVVSTTQET